MSLTSLHSWIPSHQAPLLIAGPCSAESEEQVLLTAKELKKNPQVKIFRAGCWKPRTQAGQFEGRGEEALAWLQRVKEETGLLVATEVGSPRHVEACLKAGIDVLWIGARTTGNSFAVQEIAEALRGVDLPIMVKNPLSPDLLLWEGAIERLSKMGLKKILAIHRGFSASGKSELRNLPLWKIPIQLKADLPELPLICDPSHLCGKREYLLQMSQMALDLNYDGLMLEVHPEPSKALTDSEQQLNFFDFDFLVSSLEIEKSGALSPEDSKSFALLRHQIDQLDQAILEILAKRMQASEEIAQIKVKKKLPLFQLRRFQELIADRKKRGKELGLPENFIAELFNHIHEESILHQSKVHSKKS